MLKSGLAAIMLLGGSLMAILSTQGLATSSYPLPSERYRQAGVLSMALYLATPEAQGFAVAHAASALGIPVVVTRDLEDARRHPFIVVDGPLEGLSLQAKADLSEWVHVGGTLVLDDLSSATARELAHLPPPVVSNGPTHLTLESLSQDAGPSEALTIPLTGARHRLTDPVDGKVLARYDDASVAIVEHTDNWGHVLAMGSSFEDLTLASQNRWKPSPGPSAAAPTTGVVMRGTDVAQHLLRDWYTQYVYGAATLDTVPSALAGTLIVTHDVDSPQAVTHALAFAQAELAASVNATYFVHTGDGVWNARSIRVFQQLQSMGLDVQPLGGEDPARSRKRLEKVFPNTVIDSFRGPDLMSTPLGANALEMADYHNDSSLMANDVGTVIPYLVMENGSHPRESGITEYPLLARAAEPSTAVDLIRLLDAMSAIHGVGVVTIPLDRWDGLDVEKALLAHAKGHSISPSLRDMANWWRVRARTRLDVLPRGGKWIVRLTAPEAISSLTVTFSGPRTLLSGKGALQFDATRIVVPSLQAGQPVEFVVMDPSRAAP